MLNVTVHWHGDVCAATRRAIEGSMTAAGVREIKRGEEVHAPGVVFFADIGQPLYQLLREVHRDHSHLILAVSIEDVVLTSQQKWELLAQGASDVLRWNSPYEAAGEIVARLQRWSDVEALLNRPMVRNHLVGKSAAWLSVLRQIVEVACFTNASVLVTGESGTGKELVARLIHSLDTRARKSDLVLLDCSAIVPELSGSEFFGHERGAFTGAMMAREGAFAMAKDGTLFLDEVGELPPSLQSQLLRVIQEHTYKPVGGNTWRKTDFRLVCATNRDLSAEVQQGRFRSDLYYRIATWVFRLPPLSERTEDILPLARHFMREMRPELNAVEFDEPVREYLQMRRYRGNVRELRQLIARIVQRHVGTGPVTVGDLPEGDRPANFSDLEHWQDERFHNAVSRALAFGVGQREIGQAASDVAIDIVVTEEGGNLQRAARRLGVTDRALQMRRAQRRGD